jgi:hypothetical protein
MAARFFSQKKAYVCTDPDLLDELQALSEEIYAAFDEGCGDCIDGLTDS